MRILWVNPSFLDYRVPVYDALNRMLDGGLRVVYSKERTPPRVARKVEEALGGNAIGLTGEHRLELGEKQAWANSFIRIPYQPGLMRTVLGIEADAVIGEGFFQWTPAALMKKLVQKTPLAIAYERTAHTERRCPPWRTVYRRQVLKFVDAMLCSGEQCSRYSQSLGMPADRIALGHMSADTEGLRVRCGGIGPDLRAAIRKHLRVEGVAILFIGRLVELKGVRRLMESWIRFEQACPAAATLLIAGGGPLRPQLETMVAEAGLGNVRLLGHVDYDDLAAVYAAADAFIMPTLEDNGALVVPEAMACGLPVICSKYNGMHEDLIRDGDNGWIFDPHDPDDFVDRLRVCVASASRLPEMGSRSVEIVQRHTPIRAAESVIAGCRMAISHAYRRQRGPQAGQLLTRP